MHTGSAEERHTFFLNHKDSAHDVSPDHRRIVEHTLPIHSH
jgi:hypothetical protein